MNRKRFETDVKRFRETGMTRIDETVMKLKTDMKRLRGVYEMDMKWT